MATAMGKSTATAGNNITSLWFSNVRPNPQATMRLFCLPYAGGGAQVFQQWPELLPASLEVWAVNLPGRGKRMIEPSSPDLPTVVAAFTDALVPLLDRRFAIFGHSMGALIAYESARSLRRIGAPMPAHIFASGCYAPHVPDPHPIHHLPHQEFLDELRRLGGMPKEVLENQELMELILPSLRTDFTATEQYSYTEEPPLSSAITVFGGWRDPLTTKESLEAWRSHAKGYFSVRMLQGDHFFIHHAQRLLLDLMVTELRRTNSLASS